MRWSEGRGDIQKRGSGSMKRVSKDGLCNSTEDEERFIWAQAKYMKTSKRSN